MVRGDCGMAWGPVSPFVLIKATRLATSTLQSFVNLTGNLCGNPMQRTKRERREEREREKKDLILKITYLDTRQLWKDHLYGRLSSFNLCRSNLNTHFLKTNFYRRKPLAPPHSVLHPR